MGPINCLPQETHLEIQNHFDKNCAVNYCQVSHTFNALITNNDPLWNRIFPEIIFPKEIKAKVHLDLYAVGSSSQIIERVKKMEAKLLDKKIGALRCTLPYCAPYTFTLIINEKIENDEDSWTKYALILAKPEFSMIHETITLNETCIFMGAFEKPRYSASRTGDQSLDDIELVLNKKFIKLI